MNFLQSAYQSKGKHRRVKKLMTFRSIIEKKNKGSHSELGLPVVSPIFKDKFQTIFSLPIFNNHREEAAV